MARRKSRVVPASSRPPSPDASPTSARPIWISAAISFVVSLAVYLRTLAPTVAFIDSGELTLAAARWGIPHPPGFPLWTVLTHFFTWLPIRTIAWRTNLASAVYASVAAALIAICIAELLLIRRRDERPIVLIIASTFGGLLLAFARTPWAYATLTEVYTLNLAMTLAIFAALLHWMRVDEDRWLYIAAVLFGAALGVHVITVVLTLPAIALLVIAKRGWKIFATRQFAICLVAALATAAIVYAYEPIASSRKPPIDWGGTSEISGLVDHVTAKQYRRDVTSSRWSDQWAIVKSLLSRELGPAFLALLLAIAGIYFLWRDNRLLLGFIALLIVANILWVLNYPIIDDQDAYLLTTILSLVVLASVAVAAIARKIGAFAAFALVLPIIACITAFSIRDRSQYWVAVRYAENALRHVEPNALILSNNWNFISPFTYLQPVEKMRPDVQVVTVGMLQWPWYLDQVARQYPDLMQSVRAQADAFRPWAQRWVDTPPDEWQAHSDWQAELSRTYNELLLAMAEGRLAKGRPVYATRDFLVDEKSLLQQAATTLESRYEIVPLGMLARYAPRGSVKSLPPLQFDLRGVDDGGVEWEAGDVMERVVEMYVRSYRMHGRYAYVITRQPDVAYASYRAAMNLKPDDASIAREQATFEAHYSGRAP